MIYAQQYSYHNVPIPPLIIIFRQFNINWWSLKGMYCCLIFLLKEFSCTAPKIYHAVVLYFFKHIPGYNNPYMSFPSYKFKSVLRHSYSHTGKKDKKGYDMQNDNRNSLKGRYISTEMKHCYFYIYSKFYFSKLRALFFDAVVLYIFACFV